MAELAAHRATLRKDDKSNSRSIDRAECFKLVDSSERHAVKIKKSCPALKCYFVLQNKVCDFMHRSKRCEINSQII